jgi:plastocyanin domain-containing protein
MRTSLIAASAALLVAASAAASAEPEVAAVTLTLKDHRFTPDSIDVPAGRPIRIDLINRDPAMEEFDSEDLHVEKDVTPNGKVSFVVGPLKPGTYSFMGELHADTASGTIKAVATP